MKVTKIHQKKLNVYEVTIDDNTYLINDEILIKYQLLSAKEIDSDTYKHLITDNNIYNIYKDIIKYLNYKLRWEDEVRNKLITNKVDKDIIEIIINKLKDNNYFNKDNYLSSYINDKIKLTLEGPNKIKKDLLLKHFKEEDIIKYLDYDNDYWINRIEKYINKKIKSNHNYSSNILKNKLKNELIVLGYSINDINKVLNNININDDNIYEKEYQKLYHKYENKYDDKEYLDKFIKNKLYQKGFKTNKNIED